MTMLSKILSGGQTGCDRAALDVALEYGIPTGGWMPAHFLAEDGYHPEFAAKYGMKTMDTPSYPQRTRKNIMSAHATLILALVADHSELTGGTKLTFDFAYQQGERGAGLFLVDLRQPEMIAECRKWLRECIGDRTEFILNIAGSRESKCPGIYAQAVTFLRQVLPNRNEVAHA